MRKLRLKQYVRYTADKSEYRYLIDLYRELNVGANPTIDEVKKALGASGILDRKFIWIAQDISIHSKHPLVNLYYPPRRCGKSL